MQDEIARGRSVHPTLANVVLFRRDDIVLVPIDGLPPLPLGLIWCTGHENARIRALADTARQPRSRNGPPLRSALSGPGVVEPGGERHDRGGHREARVAGGERCS